MPPDNTFLLAGTYLGEVKMFNLKNGSEESTYHCHDSQVINVQVREKALQAYVTRFKMSQNWQFLARKFKYILITI